MDDLNLIQRLILGLYIGLVRKRDRFEVFIWLCLALLFLFLGGKIVAMCGMHCECMNR